MTNTLKTQLYKLTLEQLFIIAQELDNTFWTYEDLKDFAIDKIKDDFLNIGTYIFNTLNYNKVAYYHYDVILGALDSLTPITTKADFIYFLENYEDAYIKEVFKKYQGGF